MIRCPARAAAVIAVFTIVWCSSPVRAASTSTAPPPSPYAECLKLSESGSDNAALHACKSLERALAPYIPEISSTMYAQANGKPVLPAAFERVVRVARGERLATATIADIYARHATEGPNFARDGRSYAIHVIGWALYDAKNCRDLGPRRTENRRALFADRAAIVDVERLYPRVLDQSLAHMSMSRSEYADRMEAIEQDLR